MSKPGTIFDWGTDTNFASGPATGQPVKVVLPDTGQALLPGDDLIPEYLNYGLYWTSQWVSWLNDGSPDGAADAHVVETDSIGATAVTRVREEWHFQ